MPDIFLKSYKVLNTIKIIGLWISGISLFLMMLFIVGDVVSRNFLSRSIPGGYEFVRNYFMPLTLFPALAFAYGTGIFPRITMVVTKFRMVKQRMIVILLLILEGILFFLITYYGLLYAIESSIQGIAFPAGGNLYPIYPLIFLVPICFGLIIIEIVFLIIKNIMNDEASLSILEESNQQV
ncbi:hypothetical protein BTR23_13030 [Alkalihalophilus pseudofirmus]|nr:hypothetical protein BTR23_13030 [Alkalihalophilus pseudofirmus]